MESPELNYARTAAPRRAWVWLYWTAWAALWIAAVVMIAAIVVSVRSERNTVRLGQYDGTARGGKYYSAQVDRNWMCIFHASNAEIAAGEGLPEINLPFQLVILLAGLVGLLSLATIVSLRSRLRRADLATL